MRLVAQWAPGDPAADEHRSWVRAGRERLRRHGSGRVYPTFITDEDPAGLRAAYGDGLARLLQLKQRYDPAGIFRSPLDLMPDRVA